MLWRYPSHNHPAPPGGFYFPDDAFFTHGGTGIISNEEQNDPIVQIAFPSGKLRGPTGTRGSPARRPATCTSPTTPSSGATARSPSPTPRTAASSSISRAKKVLQQIGTSGSCSHDPPRYLGSPNGDTPLANGDLLVSEMNGSYIDEITRTGKLVWSVQLPIAYPSDPQQLGPDRYLVADYTDPGRHLRVQPRGQDPLVLPPLLRARDARPPEPRRAAAGRD